MSAKLEFKSGTSAEVLKQAESVKDAYLAELSKYPNLVPAARLLGAEGKWPKWNVQVHSSNEQQGDRFFDTLNIKVDSVRWSNDFTLHVERHTNQRGRGQKRHYKKLDEANLRKIAKEVADAEKQYILRNLACQEATSVSAKWQRVRKLALTGMAIHPSIQVSIVEKPEEPTHADYADPVFALDFNRYHSNQISNYRLTTDQIAKVLAVIAEVTGLDRAFAIVKRKEHRVEQWDGTYFRAGNIPNASPSAKAYPSREDAEVEITRMSDTSREGAEIVPYTQLM